MAKYPVDEFDIQALVDSQLSWEEEKRVWQVIQDNPVLGQKYRDLVRQKRLLQAWWKDKNDSSGKKDASGRDTLKNMRRETAKETATESEPVYTQ